MHCLSAMTHPGKRDFQCGGYLNYCRKYTSVALEVQNHCPGKAGEASMYISNNNALRGGGGGLYLLELGIIIQDPFLPTVGMGEIVDLYICWQVWLGVIKSVEDSLPEKYQSGQH